MFREKVNKLLKYIKIYILFLALVGGVLGCAASSDPPLNSERIHDRFGSYGVRLLKQAAPWRVSCLFSREATGEICRTLAVVRFAEYVPDALQAPLQQVREGASLGATLADAGFAISKANVSFAVLTRETTAYETVLKLFNLPDPSVRPALATHMYDLQATRDGTRVPVARLLEVHHPAYLRPGEPERIYAGLPRSVGADTSNAKWLTELASITGLN